MSDLSKWNLEDYLTATPYGEKKTNAEKITEEEFYTEGFFVEPDFWHKVGHDIASFFNTASTGTINTVLLYGYQGTGKSTFLHWVFKKTDLFINYGKIILDMAKIPDDDESVNPFFLFDVFFREKLNKFYEEKPEEVVNLLKLLLKHYVHLHSTVLFKPYADGLTFWDRLITLNDRLKIPSGQDHSIKDQQAIGRFFDELKYNDTFILFLLFYFTLNGINYENEYGFDKPMPNIQNMIIIFDNIDSVRMEQTNARFPSSIAKLYWQFIEIINSLGLKVPILKFVFSVRDYNHSLLELQNGDNVRIKEIDFTPPENIDKIIEKRIEIANRNGKHSKASAIFNIFFNDTKAHDIFLPLFNSNLRKLAKTFVDISETLSKNNSDIFFKMGESDEKILKELLEKLQKEKQISIPNLVPSYRNGRRGIFFAVIIKALLETDNLKSLLLYGSGEEIEFEKSVRGGSTQINPARILLTIIHSLTNYTDSEENIKSQPVGLGRVYTAFREMFKEPYHVDVFFNKLTELFLLHKKNWCHLISFRNKQVFNEKVFDEEKTTVKEMIANGNFNFEFLDNIEVRINKSAHIYLTKISTHYEFFSMRAKNADPLFLLAGRNESIKNIDNVWSIVNPCLTNLINYLGGTNIDNFERTPLCLDDNHRASGRKTAMAFRIIHTQLRYIDDFRQYVFFLLKTGKINIDFAEMNKKIVFRQLRYIKKLKTLCKVRPDRYDDTNKEFLANFSRQKIKGYYHYISLLNDSRNFSSDNP